MLALPLLACDIAEPDGERFRGSFSGPFVETWAYSTDGVPRNAVVTYQLAGTVVLELARGDSSTPGTIRVDVATVVIDRTSNGCQCEGGTGGRHAFMGALSGTRDDFQFADTLVGRGSVRVDQYLEIAGHGTEQGPRVVIEMGWGTVVDTGTQIVGGPGPWTVALR
jgi:hypothetical protein